MLKEVLGMTKAMEKPIQILLVEDEEGVCDIYRQTLHNYEGMELVYVTGSEQAARDFMDRGAVDVIILDLELLEGDGLSFIFRMEECTRVGREKPLIIVVTNNSSVVTWETAKGCGADYVIPKMTREYSPLAVLSKIEKVYPFYKKHGQRVVANKPFVGLDESGDATLKYIYQYIDNMGFVAPRQGVLFMGEAIWRVMEWKGSGCLHLSNDIYPIIAQKYEVTESSIEKEIRSAISCGWSRLGEEKRKKYYPYEIVGQGTRPTNTELIENLAKHLRA